MASFKILKGLEKNLPEQLVEGAIYFCSDTGNLYIDYKNEKNTLERKLVNKNSLDSKVSKSGDTMTGRLQLNMANPHIHMKDTGYSTDWYFQAYQDQLAFGPTFANAVKTDKNGNMTVPGMTNSTKFVSSQGLAVTQADGVSGYGIALYGNATPQTYGLWFGKTSTYGTHGSVTSDWATYFGMNSGATTRGWVFRREDGCVASISGAGNLTLNGSAKIGNAVTMAYDSANECLNFIF